MLFQGGEKKRQKTHRPREKFTENVHSTVRHHEVGTRHANARPMKRGPILKMNHSPVAEDA